MEKLYQSFNGINKNQIVHLFYTLKSLLNKGGICMRKLESQRVTWKDIAWRKKAILIWHLWIKLFYKATNEDRCMLQKRHRWKLQIWCVKFCCISSWRKKDIQMWHLWLQLLCIKGSLKKHVEWYLIGVRANSIYVLFLRLTAACRHAHYTHKYFLQNKKIFCVQFYT